MDRRIERQIGNLLDRVPGYRGYRAKEDRRDADRRVREHVATEFGQEADRVERVAADLANRRRLQEIAPVDEFARDLRHLIDRIRSAPSGYGGLWSDRDVDEAALDQLRRFDEALLSGVEEVKSPIADLEAALSGNGDVATPAAAGRARVRVVHDRLDLRTEVVETGRPAPEERMLAVLEPPPVTTPLPAFNLREQDALSILGDNHLVTGRIEIMGDDQGFRLFRLDDSDPQRWLLVARDPRVGAALLTATGSTEAGAGTRETTIGSTAYTTRLAGSGEAEASGIGGASGARPASYRYMVGQNDSAARAMAINWGTERLLLVGKEVHPNDLEIYGRGEPSNA